MKNLKENLRSITQNSFIQLLIIYIILLGIFALGFLSEYTLHMEIFAVILGILGISIISKTSEDQKEGKFLENKTLYYSLIIFLLLLILLSRAIPYIGNDIPMGYDTGMYKYAIEYGLQNQDLWVLSGVEPGFLYLMTLLNLFLSTDFILRWLFILFNVLLGFSIFLTTKEYFNKKTALIALTIFTFSIIQFKVFEFMYYKNIIGIILFLFSAYFIKKEKKMLFVLSGVLIAIIHRPTFYLFGLSYLIYALSSPLNFNTKKYNKKLLLTNIILGISILVISSLFYIGKFSPAITNLIEPVFIGFIQTGESPGTFISFKEYQFTTLAYLPFAIIGFFYLARKKEFNLLFLWTLLSAIIVYFQFFFFNRFIIFLDIGLIILASVGLSKLIENKKKLNLALFYILLVILAFSFTLYAFNSKPLINQNELTTISYLSNIPQEAYAVSTSSYYSTWIQGYSNRRTIAPGLFDYDTHNAQQWSTFWSTSNYEEAKSFLSDYNKELYIFIGEKQADNLNKFLNLKDNTCLSLFYENPVNPKNKIYRFKC